MTESSGEYKEIHFKLHEIIWGEGFMSSGGPIAVAAIAEQVTRRSLAKKFLISDVD